jgi:catechol 2,3-dioxygenase-like lactoylglutathione lyase family enzyme
MDQRLSLVTLGVADLSKAVGFYTALGWEPANDWEEQDVAFFQSGGMGFALWSREELARDSVIKKDSGGWGGITLAHNVRSPEEVDAALKQAESAGAKIGRYGAETFWGGYSGIFHDPDGHAWEVAHNPHWTIAEDGSLTI